MIEVPSQLAQNLARFHGDRGREWAAGLPALAEDYCRRWQLAPDGVPMHGYVGLVVPVRRADSTPAVLKLQLADPEHPGEPQALRAWDGDGAVRLLAAEGEDARLVRTWAARVAEVATEPGNALLHWDLHYENVLAGDREPWLAIDPKPLRGDPGFDILPVLHNRFTTPADILRRYDLMVEVLGLDRTRADAWTLARTLQNALWDVEDGEHAIDPVQRAIAEAITSR